jgi:hypothetical protein
MGLKQNYVLNQDPAKWSKLEKIRYLLDHWHDIFDVTLGSSLSGSRSGAPGSRAPGRLPKMSTHESVRELGYCLRVLHDSDPVAFRHLKAYRTNVEWRNVDAVVSIRLPSGKWDKVETRSRSRIVPSWVDRDHVSKAEDRLVTLFRGDVFIPDELWNALTKAA